MKKAGKKIIFVCLFFHPEVASTGQYFTDMAVHFARRGYDVEVYTNRSRYLDEKNKLPRFEIHEGVAIHRLPCFGFSKDSKKGRIIEGTAFFLLTFVSLLFKRSGGPLFLGTNPPFLPILGVFLKTFRRWPYLIHVSDIHPHMSARLGWIAEDSLLFRVWEWFNRRAYGRAAAVVTLGRCMERFVARTYLDGRPGSKRGRAPILETIHIWEDGSVIRPLPREKNPFARENGLEDRFVILYSGSIGLHHELECLIEAAARLGDLDDVLFLFIGEGARKAKLERMVRERKLENCRFLPYQPRDNLKYSLTCGDMYVVTQERGLEGLIVSCKIFPALASGTMVLGLVHPEIEVASIIRRSGAGVVLSHEDIAGIEAAVRKAHADRQGTARMGAAGRAYFERHFDKKIVMEALEALMNKAFWQEKGNPQWARSEIRRTS